MSVSFLLVMPVGSVRATDRGLFGWESLFWRLQVKEQEQESAKLDAVFPCILRIMPTCVFNKKDPIVLGVEIAEGIAKVGTRHGPPCPGPPGPSTHAWTRPAISDFVGTISMPTVRCRCIWRQGGGLFLSWTLEETKV